MGKMKKAVKIVALAFVAIATVVFVYYFSAHKTLDFRGTVTEIEVVDDSRVFHISTESISTSYIVVADNKTKVSHCHKDDPEIDLSGIAVGDTIEGNYRRGSNDKKAKFITVWCENN